MTGVEFDDGVEKEEDLNGPDEIKRVGKKRRRGNSGKIILEIDPRKIVELTTATSWLREFLNVSIKSKN